MVEFAVALTTVGSEKREFALAQTEDEPSPYGSYLRMCQIVQEVGRPLRVQIQGSVLQITGSRDSLDVLSRNLRFLASREGSRNHTHVEYFPGNNYLDAETDPMVIATTD